MKIGKREEKRVVEALRYTDFKDSSFDRFRENKTITKEALKNYQRNDFDEHYPMLPESLKEDMEFMKDIAENVNHRVLRYNDRLREDTSYVEQLFAKNPYIYENDIPCLTSSREHTLKAAKFNSTYFNLADNHLKDDKEFCRKIVDQGDFAYEFLYMSKRLKDDTDFVLEVCKKAADRADVVINYASPRLQEECKYKDAIKTLETLLLAEELQLNLTTKKDQRSPQKKMKI